MRARGTRSVSSSTPRRGPATLAFDARQRARLHLLAGAADGGGGARGGRDDGARARALYGLRFGWKAMVGVAALVLASFALVDAGFLVFAWLTLPQRLDAVARDAINGPGDADLTAKPLLYVLATMQSVRVTRFFVFVAGWMLVLALRSLYAWSPWNFGLRLPRTDCTTGVGWAVDALSTPYERGSRRARCCCGRSSRAPHRRSRKRSPTARPEHQRARGRLGRHADGARRARHARLLLGARGRRPRVFGVGGRARRRAGHGRSASILTPEDHAAATATANATWTHGASRRARGAVDEARDIARRRLGRARHALLLSRWRRVSAVTPFSFFARMLWLLIAATQKSRW